MDAAKLGFFVVVGTRSTGIWTGRIWEWEAMGAEVCGLISTGYVFEVVDKISLSVSCAGA